MHLLLLVRHFVTSSVLCPTVIMTAAKYCQIKNLRESVVLSFAVDTLVLQIQVFVDRQEGGWNRLQGSQAQRR